MTRGDRIALVMQNIPQFVIALIASWKAGAIAVSINPMNREHELALLFADCAPKASIAHETAHHEVIARVLDSMPEAIVIATSEPDCQTRHEPRLLSGISRYRSDGMPDFADSASRRCSRSPG